MVRSGSVMCGGLRLHIFKVWCGLLRSGLVGLGSVRYARAILI